jgi:CRP/FNR family transcriptional regulator, cyclic AMP receptor protein
VKLFNQDTKVEALKRAPLFEGLSKKELAQLARVSEDLEVPAGKVLCKEGDIGHEFFVIIDGEVEITRNRQPVATRGSEDFVGEIALLEQTRRTATVTARTPLRLFVLTSSSFKTLLDDNPGVERKVLRTLARRVIELSRDPTLA